MIISIDLAAYDAEPSVGDALNSLASQSNKKVEKIIINNASADLTLEVVKRAASPSTKILSDPAKVSTMR